MGVEPDEAAFGAFLRRNHGLLSRAAYRHATCADPALTGDDIYASAVLRAWEKWPSLEPSWDDDRRRAWMIRIMINVGHEHVRASSRRSLMHREVLHVRRELDRVGEHADPTSRGAEVREYLVKHLPAALDHLSLSSRALWEMKQSGVQDEHIAAELGLALSSVRAGYSRLTATLLERLGPDFLDLLNRPHAGGEFA